MDKLLVDARTEADEAKRAELYGEIQRIIHDDGGQIAFCFADFVDAASDKLGHDKLATDWDLDGGRAGRAVVVQVTAGLVAPMREGWCPLGSRPSPLPPWS